jgi:urease accessory protein
MTLDQTFHTSIPPSLGWRGAVRLQYDRVQAKTRLASAWHQAPLKVQQPFYPESDSICHTVLIHTAGGMVGGDRLSYQVNLAPEAHAVITTAAASKIYRNPEQETEQTIELNLESDAYLEWLPQETILFNAAQFKQILRVNLAPGARWLGWDIYRLGRTARGERFLEGQWRSHTEVWQGDVPLWIDRQWLPGNATILDHPHGLNGCSVAGTLAWLGQSVERELIQELRSLWTQANLPGEVGITRLQEGLLCRYRGHSTADVRQWFMQVWNDVRFYALGQVACPPRVWQI